MLKFKLSLITVLLSIFAHADCSYCTSIEDAMENPLRVTYLDLKATGLKSIPIEISKLINLKNLDLSDNLLMDLDFSGIHLLDLESIDFENNPGLNFMEIGGMNQAFPNLRKLNVDNCSISFLSPEIGDFENLEELSISNNAVRNLPDELDKLKKISYLNASNNEISDTPWLKNMWTLQNLDLSGNEKLNLRGVGVSLLFKENLKRLAITPSMVYSGIPSEFSELNVDELELKGGEIMSLHKGVARNTSIKQIIFDGVTIENAARVYDWVATFPSLDRVSYSNMELPKGVSKTGEVKEIRFNNCSFENPNEMNKISSSTKVVMLGRVAEPNQKSEPVEVSERPAVSGVLDGQPAMEMSDEMINNGLEPILKPEMEVITISAKKPQTVELEFSKYEIPSEAFLDANGEVYEGEVDLKIVEYKDPVLNALAGAPMVYRNNGTNNIFASSGMIDFRAYDDQGRELQANPNSVIQVELNDLQPSETSDLYVFDKQDSNWVKIGVPVPTGFAKKRQRILDSLNRMTDDNFLRFTETQIAVGLSYKKSRHDPYELKFQAQKRKSLSRLKQMSATVGTGNADQYWICNNVKGWKIDTVITQDIKDVLLEIKKDQKNSTKYWKKKNISSANIPRLITDMKLDLNLEADNYKLSFRFKDSLISLPVIASFEGAPSRVQEREKRNYINYQKSLKRAKSEEDLIVRYKTGVYKNQIQFLKESRATMLAYAPEPSVEQREKLRFGLSSFGLVNCDYFSRNKPNGYVRMTKTAVDEAGNTYDVPDNVRNIFLDDNSFVSTSSERVPTFKRKAQIIIFLISALEVAVVKGWKTLTNGTKQPIIKRVSLDGVAPEDVRQRILDEN
jgi:Leucine-rich repeat (LRR) protein